MMVFKIVEITFRRLEVVFRVIMMVFSPGKVCFCRHKIEQKIAKEYTGLAKYYHYLSKNKDNRPKRQISSSDFVSEIRPKHPVFGYFS